MPRSSSAFDTNSWLSNTVGAHAWIVHASGQRLCQACARRSTERGEKRIKIEVGWLRYWPESTLYFSITLKSPRNRLLLVQDEMTSLPPKRRKVQEMAPKNFCWIYYLLMDATDLTKIIKWNQRFNLQLATWAFKGSAQVWPPMGGRGTKKKV